MKWWMKVFFFHETTQETSRVGVEGNQIGGVRPTSVTSATNAHQAYEEQTCSSLNSVVHFLQTEKTTRLHRCAKHFLHTLDISEQTVTTSLNKHNVNPIIQADNRGGNRIHQEDEKQHIRKHI